MQFYVIYDRLAEESGPIFETKNDATAVRQFKRVFENRPAQELSSFVLLRLGSIEHRNSKIDLEDIPVKVDVE